MTNKALLAGVIVIASTLAACERRTQAFLPTNEVLCCESSAFNLYAKSERGGTTALAQVFLPPARHRYLTQVKFYGNGTPILESHSRMTVTLRISPWGGDRVGLPVIWESERLTFQQDLKPGWISFDVPHVELQAGKKYAAWISGVGIQNDDYAAIAIFAMGPRTKGPQSTPGQSWQPDIWDYDYLEGTRAFWRRKGSETSIEQMARLPWVVDRDGDNLHFKMVFENMKR